MKLLIMIGLLISVAAPARPLNPRESCAAVGGRLESFSDGARVEREFCVIGGSHGKITAFESNTLDLALREGRKTTAVALFLKFHNARVPGDEAGIPAHFLCRAYGGVVRMLSNAKGELEIASCQYPDGSEVEFWDLYPQNRLPGLDRLFGILSKIFGE